MKKITYQRGGRFWVFTLSPDYLLPGETEEAAFARLLKKDVTFKDAINIVAVDESAIPTDRTFRDAWQAEGVAVTVNMVKARDIHRETLRKLRAPLLDDLDVQYFMADEEKDETRKAAIADEKRALRNVTEDPAIDAASTPDELKAVLPDALKEAVTNGAS